MGKSRIEVMIKFGSVNGLNKSGAITKLRNKPAQLVSMCVGEGMVMRSNPMGRKMRPIFFLDTGVRAREQCPRALFIFPAQNFFFPSFSAYFHAQWGHFLAIFYPFFSKFH